MPPNGRVDPDAGVERQLRPGRVPRFRQCPSLIGARWVGNVTRGPVLAVLLPTGDVPATVARLGRYNALLGPDPIQGSLSMKPRHPRRFGPLVLRLGVLVPLLLATVSWTGQAQSPQRPATETMEDTFGQWQDCLSSAYRLTRTGDHVSVTVTASPRPDPVWHPCAPAPTLFVLPPAFRPPLAIVREVPVVPGPRFLFPEVTCRPAGSTTSQPRRPSMWKIC